MDELSEQARYEAKRAANRAAFPGVAAIVDELRAVFGPGVRAVGGFDAASGRSFGEFVERWPGCEGCGGNRACDYPDRATSFCGFRKAEEVGFLIGKWAEVDFKRTDYTKGAR